MPDLSRRGGVMNMVSMKDISAVCGVSIATVSKALNNHKDIGEDTKEHIRQVAKELGYLPNSAAKTLKTNRTHNLGVLFSDEGRSGLTHDYFSHVLDSFKSTAEEKGYDINRFNISDAIRLRSYSKDFTFGNTKSEALEISNKIVPPEEVNIYLYNYKTDKYSELLFTYSDIEKYIRNNGYELSNGHAWSALHKNNKHIKDFIWGKTKEEIQKKLEESGLVTYVFYFPLNIILKFTESITEISNILKERFDIYITRTAISKIKLGKQKQSKGFTFGNSLKQLINNIYNISIEQSKTILNLAKENNLLNSQELIEWQDQLNFISVDY